MDLLLPVASGGVNGLLGGAWHWRDIWRSEPIEISQDGEEPLSLLEAKQHLYKEDIQDDDAWIASAIPACRRQVEADMGMRFVRTTLEMVFDHFPIERVLTIWHAPIVSVTSLSATDYAGTVTTMSAADYVVDTYSRPGRIVLVTGAIWPAGTRTLMGGKLRWQAGMVTAPPRAVHAMKLLLGHYDANREAVTSGNSRYTPEVFPLGYEALVSDRVSTFG